MVINIFGFNKILPYTQYGDSRIYCSTQTPWNKIWQKRLVTMQNDYNTNNLVFKTI